MASKALPSPEVLRQLLRYEPETGKLFWREREQDWFLSKRACASWNSRYAGKEALNTVNTHGYLQGTLLTEKVQAHRVAWAIQCGAFAVCCIDHIDGNRANNKWGNLREATYEQNNQNRKTSSRSKSGTKGVTWNPARKMWQARIGAGGRRMFLGLFSEKSDAARAYHDASVAMHGDFRKAVTPDEEALRKGDLVIRQRDVACP